LRKGPVRSAPGGRLEKLLGKANGARPENRYMPRDD
jgi:hypothetical protein